MWQQGQDGLKNESCLVYKRNSICKKPHLAARMQDLHARIIARESADASQDSFAYARDTLLDLFTRLDQYIVAMCVFLTVNLAHSVLSSPPC